MRERDGAACRLEEFVAGGWRRCGSRGPGQACHAPYDRDACAGCKHDPQVGIWGCLRHHDVIDGRVLASRDRLRKKARVRVPHYHEKRAWDWLFAHHPHEGVRIMPPRRIPVGRPIPEAKR